MISTSKYYYLVHQKPTCNKTPIFNFSNPLSYPLIRLVSTVNGTNSKTTNNRKIPSTNLHKSYQNPISLPLVPKFPTKRKAVPREPHEKTKTNRLPKDIGKKEKPTPKN